MLYWGPWKDNLLHNAANTSRRFWMMVEPVPWKLERSQKVTAEELNSNNISNIEFVTIVVDVVTSDTNATWHDAREPDIKWHRWWRRRRPCRPWPERVNVVDDEEHLTTRMPKVGLTTRNPKMKRSWCSVCAEWQAR